jgi:catechol 2,3-dioxygenase-like lactoylglutathione lyase family enzyme
MHLNHLDLCVPDVRETSEFFERFFGFRCQREKGRDALAILRDEAGFTLVVSRLRPDDPPGYPAQFHVGFLLDSEAAVQEAYERMSVDVAELVSPMRDVRGGPVFYVRAPGGVLVEISHRR